MCTLQFYFSAVSLPVSVTHHIWCSFKFMTLHTDFEFLIGKNWSFNARLPSIPVSDPAPLLCGLQAWLCSYWLFDTIVEGNTVWHQNRVFHSENTWMLKCCCFLLCSICPVQIDASCASTQETWRLVYLIWKAPSWWIWHMWKCNIVEPVWVNTLTAIETYQLWHCDWGEMDLTWIWWHEAISLIVSQFMYIF